MVNSLEDLILGVKLKNTLIGHEANIKEIIYSPDGRRLASVGDNTIKIWDVNSGTCLKTMEELKDKVTSIAYSPDGKGLASAGYNTVRIWDAESGACLKTLSGHRGTVLSVVYTPDGRSLACGSFDSGTLCRKVDSFIQIWDVNSGACLRTLSGPNARVIRTLEGKAVAYSPDGKRVVISIDKTIKIWDVETGACLRTLSGHNAPVRAVAYSPDEKSLASGSDDRTIKIWDVESGACLRTLDEHKDGVTSVAYSPDGKSIASGSDDQTIKIWEVDEPGKWQYQNELAQSTDNMRTVELLQKIASGANHLQLVEVEEQSNQLHFGIGFGGGKIEKTRDVSSTSLFKDS